MQLSFFHSRPFIIYIVLGLIAAILYYLVTVWGAVVGFDSYYYLRAAEGLFSGQGYGWINPDGSSTILTHYPPFYSLLIGLVAQITNHNTILSARFVVILVTAISTVILASYIHTITRLWWPTIASVAIFLGFQTMIHVNVSALSEGTFFLLFLLYMLLTSKLQESTSKWFMYLIGLILAALILSRYAAISVAISFGVHFLIENRKNLTRKFKEVFILGLSVTIPVLIWLLFSYAFMGRITNRPIEEHFPKKSQYLEALESIRSWFIPGELDSALPYDISAGVINFIEVFLVIIFIFWFLFFLVSIITTRKWNETDEVSVQINNAIKAQFCFLVIYPLILWLSASYFDASTRWTGRILSPWLLTLTITVILLVVKIKLNNPGFWSKTTIIIGSTILLVNLLLGAFGGYRLFLYGDGVTSKRFQQTEIQQAFQAIPSNKIIYTNDVPAVFFNSGLTADTLPEKSNSISDKTNEYYLLQLNQMKEEVQTGTAILVIVQPYSDKGGFYPPYARLSKGLTPIFETHDMVMFGSD